MWVVTKTQGRKELMSAMQRLGVSIFCIPTVYQSAGIPGPNLKFVWRNVKVFTYYAYKAERAL